MTIHENAENALLLSVMAMDVGSQVDSASTEQRITDLALKLIPCAAVDIVRGLVAGQLRVLASTDTELTALTAAMWKRLPHAVASIFDELKESGQRQIDQNLPGTYQPDRNREEYRRQLSVTCGITEELLLPLRVGTSDHGYLRFLFRDGGSPSKGLSDLASAFSVHAALAMDRAVLQVQVATLLNAMDSNREIGVAIGVLMVKHTITGQEAFSLLKAHSQNENRKLRDVAADVAYTGELGERSTVRIRPARMPRPDPGNSEAVRRSTHFRPPT